MLAALGLARIGREVTLVGPASADDKRTTALMIPALRFLEEMGLLEAMASLSAPLRAMRIADATGRLIRSPSVTFHASDIGEDHFGLNIPNMVMLEALWQAVEASPMIDWRRATVEKWRLDASEARAWLSDGSVVAAPLAVAADGRNSPARVTAGIGVSIKAYPQAALVLNFGHEREHGSISSEFHTETGPFTQVPLPGRRSSLVWVLAPATAKEMAALDDGTLSRRIEDRMQSMLGRVSVEPGRQVYPLSVILPGRFAANRVMLVGEAAHVFPPIGAQGLNLGIRDVQDVIEVVEAYPADPGAPAALARYDRLRRPDILARTTSVHLLNRSLLSDMLPAQLVRRIGLTLLGRVTPLRSFFMREGLAPGNGFRGVVSDLRKQVWR